MPNHLGATGVTYDAPRKKWRAQTKIRVPERAGAYRVTVKTIGRYATREEAQAAYRRFCAEHRDILHRIY